MLTYDEWKKQKKIKTYDEWKKENNISESINTNIDTNTNKKKSILDYIFTDKGSISSLGDSVTGIKTGKIEENTGSYFKSSNAFNDGYQFGDITRAITGSLADIGQDATKGISKIGEGLQDTGAYLVGLKSDINKKYYEDEINKKLKDGTFNNLSKEEKEKLIKNYLANQKVSNDMNSFIKKDLVGESNIGNIAGNTGIAGITNRALNNNLNGDIKNDYFESDSVLGDKSDSIVQSAGQLAGQIGLTAIGVPWYVTTGVTSFGGGVEEAYNEGATTEEAGLYGLINAGAEILSEKISGGIDFGAKTLVGKEAKDALTKNISNKVLKSITKFGIDATGEGFEEVFSDVMSNIGKKLTYEKDKTWEELLTSEEAMQQYVDDFVGGFVVSSGANSVKLGSSLKNKTDYDTGRTQNEDKIFDNEVKTRTEEQVKQATIEQAYKNELQAKKNLGIEITKEIEQETRQKVEQAYNEGRIKNVELSKKEIAKIEENVENDFNEGNISTDTIKNVLGENADLSKDNYLQRSIYENSQKSEDFKFEKTDNEKSNITMQSALDAGMNNTSKAHKKVDTILKLQQDTGRQYIFVNQEQLKQKGYNENANGLIDKETGSILLNISSNKDVQTTVGHEVTHIFDGKNENGEYNQEYKDLQDIAIEYLKSKGTYNTKIDQIMNAYGYNVIENEAQIKEELTADVVGDYLFNDTEFINKLSTNKNVFQKIYNYIKETYTRLKGTDEEKKFLELKNKFEEVYKTINKVNTNTETGTRYSITQNEQGQKYVKVDTDQNIFEGIEEKDYNKIAKMYMQDYLEGKTKLSENDEVNVGNKGISKYTNPKQQTTYMKEKMQLSTELKNVLEIAEKVDNSAPTKDTSKFPNWEYYKVNFEIGGKKFEGLINIGIDKNGNKHFYEINKIHTTSNSYVSTNKSSSTDSINNSIASSNTDVNTNNNDMQKNVKYSLNEDIDNSKNKLYNMNIGDVATLNIDDIYDLENSGGYRTEEQLSELRESIKENGITTPIEIYKKNNGEYAIENGNHRLQIAKELGINNIPIKIVESWENIGGSSSNNILDGDYNNGRNEEKNNSINEDSRSSGRGNTEINIAFKNGRTINENAGIYENESNSYKQTSDVQNNRDNKQLKNSNKSSFSLTQNTTDENADIRKTIEDEVGKNVKQAIDITENIEKPTIEDLLNQTPEEKQQGMKDKAKKYLSRSKTKFINKIVNDFGTSKIANTNTLNNVVDSIREDIQNDGTLSKEKTDMYFNELYNNLVKLDTDYYDTYKDVKNEIRQTKLYIPENVKSDIADYNSFRKNNMGTLIMTSDSNNMNIDTYYQELNTLYPELFPDDIVNQADQLQRISDVAKDITKVETNVAAYNDANLGKDYRNWARAEFDKNINNFVQDIKLADRYNNDTNNKMSYEFSKEEIKNIYNQLPTARRIYEKALAKEVLTEQDKIQVKRLLDGEISPDEITSPNKKGILNVATAESNYDAMQKSIKEYQNNIKNRRLEEAAEDIGDLNLWKDKKIGFAYSRETPIRNIYDIAPKNVADTIVNKYFRPYIETNEKKVIDTINNYNDRIKKLDIGTKNKYEITYDNVTKKVSESSLIQLLGENKITEQQVIDSGANASKITNAVKEFRNIYNELIGQINESMLDNGYAPIEYRKDYFPHFTEEKTDTLLGKAAKLLGIDVTNREELPTDIAGQTYKFKPGRTWFSNMLQRTTDVTDYDALKGFDKYVRGATDLIYHTEDIQRQRALANAIKGTYNDTEIQNRVEEIKESDMSDYDKSIAIQEIYNTAKDKSHLSKFIEWLDNYTNLLAGKKSINDRGAEKELNRQVYKTMTDIESRMAANAIGGNIGVALTNFAPISQAWGEVKTHNLINGIWETMKSGLKGDTSFTSESQFITRRRGADTLVETTLNKVTKPLNTVLEFADKFTSEVLVRARYNQNIQEGMTKENALQEADRYASGLMADRGRGALPTQFNNKNPIAKMINMFQVEVNNQWSYYFKDLPKNVQEKANKNKAKIVKDLSLGYTKIMVGAYLTNELLGAIRGNSTRVLPDPIYIIKELIKDLTDDDDDNDDDAIIETITEIAGNVPFIALPATLFADSLGLDVGDIGRVPVSGMIPNVADITKDIFNQDMTAGEKVKSIGEELLDTVGSSLVLPYGGSQIKKTVKGLSLYSNDLPGSYTDSGDLRYTVEDDVGSKIQAGIFGAYANPYAQDYIDSGFKTIKKDNIDEMVGLDMNSTEYRKFKSDLSKVSDTTDKNGYKQYVDDNNNTYWYDDDKKTMYDNNYKKTTLTADDLVKVSKKEQALNYINSLDLTDAQKNLAANNLNKNSKKKIDMSEYGNYGSYDEYQYARDYPEKYSVITQIDSYNNYNKYKYTINEISKKYKEMGEGATSKQKTQISKAKKQEIQGYIESLDLSVPQKMMLEKEAGGYSINNYKNYIYQYLENTSLDGNEKYNIWKELFE